MAIVNGNGKGANRMQKVSIYRFELISIRMQTSRPGFNK